jgi:amino-acid N-acetyltransferase
MINGLRAAAFAEAAGNDTPLVVRKAAMSDIRRILNLINDYAARGLMLPRTEFELSEAIRDFSVVSTASGEFLGCGALHFYSPTLGEIRSLAVKDEAKTRGAGRKVVEALVSEAQDYRLDAVFAFTYVVEFFGKVGFQVIERGALPLKAWKDCLRCTKFQECDEVAVIRVLRPDHWSAEQPEAYGPGDPLIQIPTPRHL